MAVAPEVDLVSLSVDNRLVLVTGDVESERPTGDRGVCQEEEGRIAVDVGTGPGGQNYATVADAVFVDTLDQVGNNVLVKVEEMMEKLKTENLLSHVGLVGEWAGDDHALVSSFRLQRDWKKAVEEKEEALRLLALEKTRRENIAVIEHFKENVLTATMKAIKEIGGSATSLA